MNLKENMKTDIIMVLDRSGSMADMKFEVDNGINNFIEEQKNIEGEATFTLAQFDDKYEIVHDGINIKDVPKFECKPRNMTALYDAIGKTITSVGERLHNTKKEDRPDKVLFIIVTDGHENASLEYDYDKISGMIKHQKDVYSWDFVYMGAGLDTMDKNMHLQFGKGIGAQSCCLQYGSSASYVHGYNALSRSTTEYRAGNTNFKWDKEEE